ncbi:hypothetical protein ACFQZ2_01705 [Streptomonospora algeriensis]|uniref:Uncharacterized protein n=1 Tax=Streptomonospora algeriensis TaxID=995084 RepID=A0ABW3BBM0_9ACTN
MITGDDPTIEAARLIGAEWQKMPGANPPDSAEIRYRKRWSSILVARGKQAGDIPVYGSTDWAQLPDSDPRKAAAAIRAAEAWASEGDDLAFRLRREDHERRTVEDAHWEAVNAGRADIVDDYSRRVLAHHNRAAAQQEQAERAQTGHDYQGGPVDWETGRSVKGSTA